ncbi:MAG: UvrD-helicase domain-containing protein [Candidatus Kapaibacterium sp.]|nr:UvrD-helicase domain-containing protein [Ignavibacteriota bacterium]MCB9220366.1 UvrD-helicase domain-containing protein [Ignavibacteria bacterium]
MTEQEFLVKLTNEQKEATLKFDDDVSVTANAGSGKTTLLVMKYLYLQLFHSERFNYKNIVAITFTNKAASEIKEKIRKTINSLLNKTEPFENVELDEKQKQILQTINRNIVNLEVGTIHKFCRRLIKDHAFRAGLEPNFTIIDETERSILISKIIDEVLSEEKSDLYEHIVKLILFLGVEESVSLIQFLVLKKEHLQKQKEFYSKNLSQVIDYLNSEIKEIYKKNILRLAELIESVLTTDQTINEEIKKSLLLIVSDLKSSQYYDYININELVEKLSFLRKPKGRLVLKDLIGELEFKNLESILSSISTFSSSMKDENNKLIQNRIEIGLALVLVAEEVNKRYNALNYKNNRLDNDSTIDVALKLLNDKVVKEIVQDELAYVMIDEFQDTDDRQLAIANLIRDSKKVKIFVVGDDKQSIYSFRNADVRVFKNLRANLKEENRLELNTSFRSNLEINAFVNDLFSQYMSSKKSEYDIDYQSIVSFKSTIDSENKNINILLYDDKHLNSDEDTKNGFYSQIMKSINYLINERGAAPNDICILSSSSYNFPTLANILAENGLEYDIMAGSGFFDKNEVKSLIAYLEFIDSPENDLLCAATLKSSLFNYTDNDLYKIGTTITDGDSFWDKFRKYADINSNPIHKDVKAVLEKSIKLSNKLPLSDIIIKIIDDSNWNYFYQNDKNQSLIFRNLYKFMSYINSIENRPFSGIGHTLELLNHDFKSNKLSEDVDPSSKSIKLSTIHSAKGLEFKHVIILDFDLVNLPSGSNRNTSFSENLGLSIKLPTSIDKYEEFAKSKSPIDLLIYEKDKIADKAENLRLFYVAATRAEESLHLIVKNGKSALQKVELQKIFNIFKDETNSRINSTINIYDKDSGISELNCEYSINTDNENTEICEYKFDIEKSKVKVDLNVTEYIGTVEALEKEINFSATKLSMLQDIRNTEKFKETYIYGLPIIGPSNLNFDNDELAEPRDNKISDGTEYGIFFHSIMENINTLLDSQNNIIDSEFINVLTNTELEYQILLKENDSEKLKFDLQNVLASNFINKNYNTLLNSKKEFDLKLAFGDHTLMAIYDAVYFDNNIAEIWDWKTNKFYGNDTLVSKASNYDLQMNMYALFAFKFDSKIEEVNSRLFFIDKLHNSTHDEDWIFTKQYKREDINKIQIEIAELIGAIKGRYPNTYPVSPVNLNN